MSSAVVVLLAGCGDSSRTNPGRTRFCVDNAKLAKATASATTLGDVLTDLKANQSTVEDFGTADSTGAFATRKFADAGKAVGDYCGQAPRGNGTL